MLRHKTTLFLKHYMQQHSIDLHSREQPHFEELKLANKRFAPKDQQTKSFISNNYQGIGVILLYKLIQRSSLNTTPVPCATLPLLFTLPLLGRELAIGWKKGNIVMEIFQAFFLNCFNSCSFTECTYACQGKEKPLMYISDYLACQ